MCKKWKMAYFDLTRGPFLGTIFIHIFMVAMSKRTPDVLAGVQQGKLALWKRMQSSKPAVSSIA